MKFEKSQDRRVKRSRKLMQDALLELLENKDYAKISVSEITELADVARTTFYSHFQTKDELLLSYIDDIFETFFTKLREQYSASNTSRLGYKAPLILVEEWQKNKDALEKIRSADVDPMIYWRFREIHELALEGETAHAVGATSHPVAASYVNTYLTATTFSILMQWTDNGLKETAETIAKVLHDLLKPETLDLIREPFQEEISTENGSK